MALKESSMNNKQKLQLHFISTACDPVLNQGVTKYSLKNNTIIRQLN